MSFKEIRKGQLTYYGFLEGWTMFFIPLCPCILAFMVVVISVKW